MPSPVLKSLSVFNARVAAVEPSVRRSPEDDGEFEFEEEFKSRAVPCVVAAEYTDHYRRGPCRPSRVRDRRRDRRAHRELRRLAG